jgi:hypothetical protein
LTEVDLNRYKLSEDDNEKVFRRRIVPREFYGAVAQARPIAVFIGGQPGAGKTATTQMAKSHLDQRGGVAHVCGDFYKPYHPDYARLLREDDATAGAYTRLDSREWHAKAEEYARRQRFDVVVESALADPDEFAEVAGRFREAGYGVRVAALAVPAAQSRLGIMQRYAEQVRDHGRGRWVAQTNHDRCYDGMLDTVDRIDADRLADRMEVYRRGNILVYANALGPDGQWEHPPQARSAILAERHRPWTAEEIAQCRAQVLQTRRDLDQVWTPEYSRRLNEIIDLAAPALPPGEGASLRAAAEIKRGDGQPAHEQDGASATAEPAAARQAEPAAVVPDGTFGDRAPYTMGVDPWRSSRAAWSLPRG